MNEKTSVIDIAPQAIEAMCYGDFKERFIPCFETVKQNADMLVLVGNIWQATNKRFPKEQNSNDIIARYPALLTSFILVANHYEELKNTNPNHLSALAHATYYLTNGLTEDLVTLFGDGLLISKIDDKVDSRHNDASARQVHTLNAMSYLFNEYQNLKQNQESEQIKQNLCNYIDALAPAEVKHLEPTFALNEEDFELIYSLILGKEINEGGEKHENRRV